MEEIDRVARYWQRVKEIACQHPELVFEDGTTMTCGHCRRPIRMMSDTQIEEIRRHAADTP